MKAVLRLAVMWVLALAVPFQAVAAATMFPCGMAQDSIAHLATHQHPDGSSAEIVSGPRVVGDHHHSQLNAHRDENGKTAPGVGFTHKCGGCAACCSGAAAPAGSLIFGAVKLADFFAPLVTRSIPAYVAEGLERPPRPFFD